MELYVSDLRACLVLTIMIIIFNPFLWNIYGEKISDRRLEMMSFVIHTHDRYLQCIYLEVVQVKCISMALSGTCSARKRLGRGVSPFLSATMNKFQLYHNNQGKIDRKFIHTFNI